ncbi:major capsid protein [Bdellovibrio bacteriovorus]|uniref:major capsid protein n=1 Tax=Bdellovibrio bacteriovorus TaxID=959 RepID=UPI003AA9CC68
MSKKNAHLIALASSVLTDRHRHTITAVVEEIGVGEQEDTVINQLMPITDRPSGVLEHEILHASGGKTQERVIGAPGKSVVGPSSTSKLYKPGSYQEFSSITENDLLNLRKLGSIGERGATGLTAGELSWVERIAVKLQLRLGNRLRQLRWDAMFTGAFVYQDQTFNFGIPVANKITLTDWEVAGADPFKDLVSVLANNPKLRKYKNLIKGFVINPKTEADIIQRSLEKGYIANANIHSAGINVVKTFAAPGLPDFITVGDVTAEETVTDEGEVVLGDATFLVPDNKILVVMDFNKASAKFPMYGEMQITENLNDPSATLDKPATGIYAFLDEEGLRDRKSPGVDYVAGFNGGPNLMRPNDVFILEY